MAGAFEAMAEAARDAGLPRRHRRDLTLHDRRWLALGDNAARPFGWVMHEEGTVRLVPGGRRVDALVGTVEADLRGPLWFWWDGAELRQLSGGAEMRARLREEGARWAAVPREVAGGY